jgi:hypothetical protein
LFQRLSIFHKFVNELNRIARLAASDGVRERVKKELHFSFTFTFQLVDNSAVSVLIPVLGLRGALTSAGVWWKSLTSTVAL